MPVVTAVIVNKGQAQPARVCVESIRSAGEADSVQVEIIVVDSSPPQVQSQLQAICAQLGVNFISGPPSTSGKRKLGAELASTEYVLFLDSDCLVMPWCFISHLTTLSDPTVHASQGIVSFHGSERLAARACVSFNVTQLPAGQTLRWASGGNLMVRRGPFLGVRFDQAMGHHDFGEEDMEFGLRFSSRGYRIVGTPGALVSQDTVTWKSFRTNFARFFSLGRTEACLIERHRDMSYVDMPSPALVMMLLTAISITTAWLNPMALLMLPIVFFTYAVFTTAVGVLYSQDWVVGALGHWMSFMMGFGRLWESLRLKRPHLAFRRIRFTESQITQEWPNIVLISWGVWIMVLVGLVFQWRILR